MPPPMTFIICMLLGCAISGTVGFLLGYTLGRRTAERQGAFPVVPVEAAGTEMTRTPSPAERDATV